MSDDIIDIKSGKPLEVSDTVAKKTQKKAKAVANNKAATKAITDEERERLTRIGFQPGQSGNPSGRPKMPHNVRNIARQYTEEAMERMVELMRTAENENVRLQAMQTLVDRGWGKSIQQTEIGEAGAFSALDEADIAKTLEDLDSRIEAIKKTA